MGMFGNAFKPGGAGRNVAGYIGDALAQIGGMKGVYGPAVAAQREFQERAELARQQRDAESSHPQAINLGSGGFGTWSARDGLNVLREPVHQTPEAPALQQNFAWLKGLPPEDQKLAATMLPGYAFTPSGVATAEQRAAAVAEAAARARAMYRAPPAAPRSKPMSLPGGFILDN